MCDEFPTKWFGRKCEGLGFRYCCWRVSGFVRSRLRKLFVTAVGVVNCTWCGFLATEFEVVQLR